MAGKRCPWCGRIYDDPEAAFCPDDGRKLLQRASAPIGRGTVIGKRWKIDSELGGGGMGTVYRARDTRTGVEAAIKILDRQLSNESTFVERFEREARAAARIRSDNVVRVYGLGRDESLVYLVMEYVDGESLRDRLDRGPMLPLEVAHLGHQIAGALEAAHEASVLHRDLKPDNVMVASSGLIKIVDFGLARIAGLAQRLTKTGARLGSPAYMSPEAVRGAELSPRSDLYSLGILLFEALVGKPPFESRNVMAVVGMHLSARPARLADTHPDAAAIGLAELIDDLLAKSPDGRPGSAAEVRVYLASVLGGGVPGH